MTTHSFSGFRITTTNGTPSDYQASSMTWLTNENTFRFQYSMDNAQAGSFSSITLDLPCDLLCRFRTGNLFLRFGHR